MGGVIEANQMISDYENNMLLLKQVFLTKQGYIKWATFPTTLFNNIYKNIDSYMSSGYRHQYILITSAEHN